MANKTFITYKFRIKDRSRNKLSRYAASCNFVWNYCVNAQKHATKWRTRWPSGFDLINLTSGCSVALNVQSSTINDVCRQFAKSRDQKKKCPKYRGRKSLGWIPFGHRDIRIEGDSFIYRKQRFYYWNSRNIQGVIKCGSLSQDAKGNWYINVCAEIECSEVAPKGIIGIDLGLKDFAVLSNGKRLENPRHFRKYEQSLAVAQKAKNKRRVKAIHNKIANCRKDFLHKQSSLIAKSYGQIVVGNVNASKLAKTKMAKSVLDAGWSTFRGMLAYKAIRHAGQYIEVDERYSSVTCSSCGARSGPKGQKGLQVRSWACSSCGVVHDRDVNAATNILCFGAEYRPPVAGNAVRHGY